MTSLKHPVVYNTETKELVVPAGRKAGALRGEFTGAVAYDETRDKGKLVCVHCFQAAMMHRDEKLAVGDGTEYGWQSHFSTIGTRAPKKQKLDAAGNVVPYIKNAHKADCVEAVLGPAEDDDPDKTDYTKGYKIYLDMGQMARAFKRNASPVTRDPETRRIISQDPDLVDRERVTIKDTAGFIRALKGLDAERLNDAVIVSGGRKYGFREWFVRVEPRSTGHPDIRWVNLGKRLLSGNTAPVMAYLSLEGKTPNQVFDNLEGSRQRYHVGTVVTGHPTEPRKVTIKFWLNVRNRHLFDVVSGAELQHFLVMSRPDIFQDHRNKGVYHVDLSVRNPRWLSSVSLAEVSREAAMNAERRREKLEAAADFKLK